MKTRTLQFVVAIAAACIPSFGQQRPHFLGAVADGSQLSPPVATSATAFGSFTLNRPSNTLSYRLTVSGMTGTAAHIHVGAAGSPAGPVLLPLNGGPMVWEGMTTPLAPADVVTLLNEGMYVDVHSAAFPAGEIRGQLIPASMMSFNAALNGAQEVPPNGSAATAFARVRLNEPERRLLYDMAATGTNWTVAHIHIGNPGMNGPPLVTLNFANIGASGQDGIWCGVSQQLSVNEVATLKAGGMYVNIHSNAFPNGQIRGQLIPSTQPFTVSLAGAEAVPPNNSAAIGRGRLDFNHSTDILTFDITTSPLPSGFLSASIHQGVVGQNGPVVINLVGGPTHFTGSAQLSGPNPDIGFKGGLYVNIASMAFPGGEIRGQIWPDPYVFGDGRPGTNGRPRIDARGYDGITSNDVTISVRNLVSGATVFTFIATGTTFSTALGVPLPASVPPIGVLWIDADPNFYLPMTANSIGCASITVPLPTDPTFDGFRAYLQIAGTDPINPPMLVLSDALELTIL